MRRPPGWPLALALLAGAAACGSVATRLARTEARLASGDAAGARAAFDLLAGRGGLSPAERVRALTGAGLASLRLGQEEEAIARFERAVEPEVPGASEPALYHLAEVLRLRDRARARGLYYRAAAGAAAHRARAFPYEEASRRLAEPGGP